MRKRIYHLLNRLFDFLKIPIWLETKEEVEEKYQKLIERLKREGVYRDD